MDVLKKVSLKQVEKLLFYLLILFLPSQLGKHFWPDFSLVMGIRVDYLSPTLYLTDILVGLLFFVSFKRISKHIFHSQISRGGIVFFLFVILLAIQILLSGNALSGLYHLLKLFEFTFLAFYTTVTVFISFKKISFALASGVIFESLLSIAQYLYHGSLGGIFYWFGERTFTAATPGIANASIAGELVLRPYGTFPHPNILAGYLLISMLFIFFFLFKSKYKGIAVLSLFLGSSALLLTLSRIAILLWLVFIAGVVVWQIKKSITQKKKHLVSLVVGLIAIGGIGWLAFSQILVPRFTQSNFTEESSVQRAALLEGALEMTLKQPILGVGLGNFLPSLAAIRSPLSLGLYLQPVHNIFLFVAAQTGLIGVGIFIWFLVKTYMHLIRLLKIQKKYAVQPLALLWILTSIIILGQFDHYFVTLQQGQLLFAVVLGLCWKKQEVSF